MSSEKMVTVNKLPARTWNWLKMNEAVLSSEKLSEAEYTLRLSDGVSKEKVTIEKPEFETIETGMGQEMSQMLQELPVLFLETKKGQKEEQLSVLKLPAALDQKEAFKVYLHAAEDSDISLAIMQGDGGSSSGILAIQVKILVEKNARVRLYMSQLAGDNKVVLSDVGSRLQDGAALELVRLELGGEKAFTGVQTNLLGKESDFQMDLAYLGNRDKKLDMNYVAKHLGKKTTSRMDVNGVLNDKAEKLFRGTIDFVAGCSGAKGDEKEDVLLLSEEASNQTIPLILCAEEDVEGNHGATIGGLDEKTLFYMASRAISQKEAERIIARAGIESLAERIKEQELQAAITQYLDEKVIF